ncbi:hypothetical protein L596_027896 [Steinernema carpocapsae]|uniref:Uncharacterized protein n=1 Tax=Steinernema carpocapsae TaxID=34508 RepID=A0A4U5LWW7_STECR|nr:hypothetical protein L596_027896 [Steinernema carpocapsae]
MTGKVTVQPLEGAVLHEKCLNARKSMSTVQTTRPSGCRTLPKRPNQSVSDSLHPKYPDRPTCLMRLQNAHFDPIYGVHDE